MGVNKRIISGGPPPQTAGFNIVTYTGDGASSKSITGVGFQPDFVWVKSRSATWGHFLQDSTRGAENFLKSNSAELQGTTIPHIVDSFDSDGFTVFANGNSNNSGDTYVAWCWKATGGTTSTGSGTNGVSSVTTQANTAGGFSIIKFVEGTSSSSSVNHGLDSTPEFILSKRLTRDHSWFVYHEGLGTNQYLRLQEANGVYTSSSVFGTDPDSTKINLGAWQTESDDYGAQTRILYAFHSVAGYSSIGSYAGNGSSQTITTGFQPDFVMLRKYDDTQDWMIWDSVRDSNPKTKRLEANNSDAEVSETTNINFISTGFELTTSYYNDSGKNSIYIAFKIT